MIIQGPDPRLAAVAQPVRGITHRIDRLFAQMRKVMRANNGLGLAAPQIGVPLRCIVVGKEELCMANPVIVKASPIKRAWDEGCLSFPGLTVRVARSAMVRVQFLDRRGREREQMFSWSLGGCIQHEIDHLDGITIADRATSSAILPLAAAGT